MKKIYTLKSAILLTFLFILTGIVNAQSTTWVGGQPGSNWSNGLNWSNGVPTGSTAVTINNGATVNVNIAAVAGSVSIGGGGAATSVTITGTNSLTVNGNVSIAAGTTTQVLAVGAGTLNINGGGILSMTGGNSTRVAQLTISTGTANITGGITLNNGGGGFGLNQITFTGAGTLNIGGDFTSGGTFTRSTGTVNYNKAGAQTVGSYTYNNLTLSGSGTKTTSSVTVNTGKLSLQGSAVLGNAVTFSGGASMEFKGNVQQTTTNIDFPTTMNSPVVIDNVNGVVLNGPKTLTSSLTLTNGYLKTTSTNLLSLSSASTASTANGAFVDGPLLKNTSSGTAFSFPVGKQGSGLRSVSVTPANASASVYTAEYFNTNPKTAVGSNLGTIDQISNCEYWDVARTSGANAAITLTWLASGSNCGSTQWGYIGNLTSLLVAHYNGTAWVTAGNASTTGTAGTAGSITSTSQSSFSPFTLGTSNGLQNPLPVKFANVKAFQRNAGVQVEWTNMTEKDVVRYVVERSSNGVSFSPVAEQLARGNQDNAEQYSVHDASPVAGANYYRVTAVEITGKTIYSNIMKVDMGQLDKVLSLYPNPVKNHQVNFTFSSQRGQYHVSVYNNNGQVVFSKTLQHDGGAVTQMIELPASVKTGVYSLKVSGDGFSSSKPFIVQ